MGKATGIININGWTLEGVSLSKKDIEKISEVLNSKDFNSHDIRKTLSFMLPITIDYETRTIYFWQVVGVTFCSSTRFSPVPTENTYLSVAAIPFLENIFKLKNVSDEEMAEKINENLGHAQKITVNQAAHYVYFNPF